MTEEEKEAGRAFAKTLGLSHPYEPAIALETNEEQAREGASTTATPRSGGLWDSAEARDREDPNL